MISKVENLVLLKQNYLKLNIFMVIKLYNRDVCRIKFSSGHCQKLKSLYGFILFFLFPDLWNCVIHFVCYSDVFELPQEYYLTDICNVNPKKYYSSYFCQTCLFTTDICGGRGAHAVSDSIESIPLPLFAYRSFD